MRKRENRLVREARNNNLSHIEPPRQYLVAEQPSHGDRRGVRYYERHKYEVWATNEGRGLT